jgi:putative endonuclease
MSRAKGNIAEEKACQYLVKQNFRIIERNFYTKYGEIDIIAFKEEVLYFVEVKSGVNFDPADNITLLKIDKITKSIYVFLKSKNINFSYNISAIIIRNEKLEFIENITI